MICPKMLKGHFWSPVSQKCLCLSSKNDTIVQLEKYYGMIN